MKVGDGNSLKFGRGLKHLLSLPRTMLLGEVLKITSVGKSLHLKLSLEPALVLRRNGLSVYRNEYHHYLSKICCRVLSKILSLESSCCLSRILNFKLALISIFM